MANTPSAKKRVKINKRNNKRNTIYKSKTKTSIKHYINLIKESENNLNNETTEKLLVLLRKTISQIDKAAKKKIYHKNTAARKKSKLHKLFNTL